MTEHTALMEKFVEQFETLPEVWLQNELLEQTKRLPYTWPAI